MPILKFYQNPGYKSKQGLYQPRIFNCFLTLGFTTFPGFMPKSLLSNPGLRLDAALAENRPKKKQPDFSSGCSKDHSTSRRFRLFYAACDWGARERNSSATGNIYAVTASSLSRNLSAGSGLSDRFDLFGHPNRVVVLSFFERLGSVPEHGLEFTPVVDPEKNMNNHE
jgi:hypothetical protein